MDNATNIGPQRGIPLSIPFEIALAILRSCEDLHDIVAWTQVSRSFYSAFKQNTESLVDQALLNKLYHDHDCLRHALCLDVLLQYRASQSFLQKPLMQLLRDVQNYSYVIGGSFSYGNGTARPRNDMPWNVLRAFEYYKASQRLRKWHISRCAYAVYENQRYIKGVKHFYLYSLGRMMSESTFARVFMATLPSTERVCPCIRDAVLDAYSKTYHRVDTGDLIEMAHLLVILKTDAEKEKYVQLAESIHTHSTQLLNAERIDLDAGFEGVRLGILFAVFAKGIAN